MTCSIELRSTADVSASPDPGEDYDPRAERLVDLGRVAAPSSEQGLSPGYGDARDSEMRLIHDLMRVLHPRLPRAGEDELEDHAVRFYQALCARRDDERVVARVATLLGVDTNALRRQLSV